MAPKLNIKERIEDGELDLAMSELDEVPVKEIAQFPKVTSLDLSNNHLQLLPKQFVTLTQLVKLDLSKNKLTELPENFGNLHRLRSLDLYSNKISHLPLSFGNLKALKFLDLKDNPLMPGVAKVVGPCLDAQQCNQSAKNAVAFYAQMQASVQEEKEKREVQRQKSKETKQKQPKPNKNAKKQEKGAKQVKEADAVDEEPKENVTTIKTAKLSTENTKQCCSAKLFIWSVIFLIFVLLMFYSINVYGDSKYVKPILTQFKNTSATCYSKFQEIDYNKLKIDFISGMETMYKFISVKVYSVYESFVLSKVESTK